MYLYNDSALSLKGTRKPTKSPLYMVKQSHCLHHSFQWNRTERTFKISKILTLEIQIFEPVVCIQLKWSTVLDKLKRSQGSYYNRYNVSALRC